MPLSNRPTNRQKTHQTGPTQNSGRRYKEKIYRHLFPIFSIILILITSISIASATIRYTVQPGDTLYSLAQTYSTTVDDLVAENGIVNPDLIYVGQLLEIQSEPTATAPLISPTTAEMSQPTVTLIPSPTTVAVATATPTANPGQGTVNATSTTAAVVTPTATESNTATVTPTPDDPVVMENLACARFSFEAGRDSMDGAVAGLFVMADPIQGEVTSWFASDGELESDWINGLPLRFDEIYVQVEFYDLFADEEDPPVMMEIVNPAGGTPYGWLARGVCHAIEIQYPTEFYSAAFDASDNRFTLIKP